VLILGEHTKIHIMKITPMIGKGNLKAFVDIVINDTISIYGCRVIQQEGQRPWVSMPQVEYQKNGHKKYFAVVKILDEKLKEDINDAILTAYKDGA